MACGQKWFWPSWSQGEWMSEWMIYHADANSRKLRIIDFNNFWMAVVKNGHGTLILMNE